MVKMRRIMGDIGRPRRCQKRRNVEDEGIRRREGLISGRRGRVRCVCVFYPCFASQQEQEQEQQGKRRGGRQQRRDVKREREREREREK